MTKPTFPPHLRNKLDNTTSLLDLSLRLLGEVPRTNDDRHLRESALAEDLGVTERKEVDDGSSVGLHGVGAQVLGAGLGGDERPELRESVLVVDVPLLDF